MATLAEEIRDLSHDLHPGVPQHAGLVTALTSASSGWPASLRLRPLIMMDNPEIRWLTSS